MKKYSAVFKPAAVIIMFALLYGVSLPYRPLFAPAEYDFAVKMMNFFPEISGRVLPKLPALAATMLCALLLWIAAAKMRLFRPWIPVVIYLLLPPVWFFGTAALPEQLMTLSVLLTVMLIFFARKTENRPVKIGLALLACPAAAAAALLIRSDLFSWQGIPMALLPLLALHTGIYLEKRDDRNRAGKILDRLGYLLAFLLLTALGILLYAPVCRHFGFTCPEVLKFYPSGRSLLRPALALLVPLLWLFMGKKAEKMADKLLCIAAGAAFVMLALPPALPWTHLLHDIPGTAVTAIAGEIKSNVPAYFADRDSAGVLIYELQIPVQTIGRREGELHPGELKKQLENILRERDVVIALSNKDMDSYLPQIGGIVYTSGSNRRIIRYSGGKK